MPNRKVCAWLINDRVKVDTPNTHFTVSRRDLIQGADGRPIDCLAGALTS
jgi:hypothetical protein